MPGLRIMAGSARGRNLKLPHTSREVRPILSRIKKSLFDIIRNRLPDSDFLDLFSGTGSVGIEAISWGAQRAVFVEKEFACVDVIKENLRTLGFLSRAVVEHSSAESFIAGCNEKYDLIFMGPPYKNENGMLYLSMPVLALIEKQGILKNGGLIIVQHHKREQLKDLESLKIAREEKYGDSRLTFYKTL